MRRAGLVVGGEIDFGSGPFVRYRPQEFEFPRAERAVFFGRAVRSVAEGGERRLRHYASARATRETLEFTPSQASPASNSNYSSTAESRTD